jgi:O-antigen ligase
VQVTTEALSPKAHVERRHRFAIPLLVWVVVACTGLFLGWTLVTRPLLDSVFVVSLVCVCLALALAAVAGWTVFRFAVVMELLLASTVDLLRYVVLGPVTLLGATTVVIVILAVGFSLVHRSPRDVTLSLHGLHWFLAWTFAAILIHAATIKASQNIAVFTTFVTMTGATAAMCRSDVRIATVIYRWFDRAVIITIILYLASVVAGGLGSDLVIGARVTALFEVLAMARGLALIRHGDRRRGAMLALGATTVVLLSLSRTALAVCVILVPLAWLDRRSLSRRATVAAVFVVMLGLFLLAVLAVKPLRDRFAEPDRANIGGVSVSVSGRTDFWAATIRSWRQSPWIGNGPGTSEYLPAQYLPKSAKYSHPHDDYLRVLHDYGVVGAALWLWGAVSLYRRTKRDWRAAPRHSQKAMAHGTAVLAMTGIALTMTTDNAIVYLFVMLPLSILVGASLGFGRSQGIDKGDATSPVRGHAQPSQALAIR